MTKLLFIKRFVLDCDRCCGRWRSSTPSTRAATMLCACSSSGAMRPLGVALLPSAASLPVTTASLTPYMVCLAGLPNRQVGVLEMSGIKSRIASCCLGPAVVG